MPHFGGGVGNVLRMQPFVDGLPGFAAIVGPKRARGRDGDDHALRVAGIVNDGMQTHASSAWLPLRTGAVAAKSRKLLPGFAAVFRTEDGGIFNTGVDDNWFAERRFDVPDALELPGVLRAVVPLVRGEGLAGLRGGVVDELVAFALGHSSRSRRGFAGWRSRLDPSFAAVIGALDNLDEPPAGLRRVDAVGTRGRSFHVVNLPAGKMRAADGPFFALAVRRQNERALPCPHQHANFAHGMLLSVLSGSPFYQGHRPESNQLRKEPARKRASRKDGPNRTNTPKQTGESAWLKSEFPTRSWIETAPPRKPKPTN